MRKFSFVLLVLLFCAVIPAVAAAQNDPLRAGIEAYNNSDYDKALELLHQVLENKERYSSNELAECHRYLAMIHLAYAYNAKARALFVQALEYNPNLTFDKNLTAPKILQTFEEAKREFEDEKKPAENPKPQKPQEPAPAKPDNRRAIAGWTLVGIGGASLITSGVTYGLMYGKASDAQTAIDDNHEELYNALKDDYETLGIVSGTTLGVGLVAAGVGTYLLVTGKTKTASIPVGNVEVSVLPSPRGLALGMRF